jgi:serine/threonine protein kinase
MRDSTGASRRDENPRMATPYELGPGDRLDGFEVRSVLARGGMSSVLLARRPSNGEDFVLKVPHLHFESDVVFYSRFEREEQIGLRVQHPGIVKLIPVQEKSRPYLVMEYVRGRTLRQLLDDRDTIPVERALALAQKLCEALCYLHEQGVIHRDLKPENVIVDETGDPKLLDFGIACDRSSRRLTWTGLSARLGTPDYMAPEQIHGQRGDERVDVYALGLVLHELLSGELPHKAPTVSRMTELRTHGEARDLAAVVPGLDRGIAAVVMRALARRPSDRFMDAHEMLSALRSPGMANGPAAHRSPESPRHATVVLLLGIVTSELAMSVGVTVLRKPVLALAFLGVAVAFISRWTRGRRVASGTQGHRKRPAEGAVL